MTILPCALYPQSPATHGRSATFADTARRNGQCCRQIEVNEGWFHGELGCSTSCHGCDNRISALLGRRDKVTVSQVSVACGGLVPPVPKQFADQGQVFAGHDGVTGGGVPQVMQPQPAELRIRADRTPAGGQYRETPAFGMAREQVRLRVAGIGQRLDMRSRGFAERHRVRAGLGVGQLDRVLADVAPAAGWRRRPGAIGPRGRRARARAGPARPYRGTGRCCASGSS